MLKIKKIFLFLIISLIPFFAVSENNSINIQNNNKGNPTKENLIALSYKKNDIDEVRYKILSETAFTLGFRGGMADRSKSIIQQLKKRASALDVIFNFSSLVSKNSLLPPVIVEANNLASFSTDQIRTANKTYKILAEEKFVSNPPHWSDYLFVGLKPDFNEPDEKMVDLIHPKTKKEKRVWRESINKGWIEGQNLAIDILTENFNRITRDYTGMLRYSELLQIGAIKKGKTATSVQNLTGDQKEIILGDKLQRIIERSKFELNVDKWRPSYSINIKKD